MIKTITFLPTKKDLAQQEDAAQDVSWVCDLDDDELASLMGPDQYSKGYKLGCALAQEYIRRTYLKEEN